MNTVHISLNNELTNLQRLDAEGMLPEESLASLDKLIAENVGGVQTARGTLPKDDGHWCRIDYSGGWV